MHLQEKRQRTALTLLSKPAANIVLVALLIPLSMAEPVAVRHSQGLIHGFLVLRDNDDKLLASGESLQTARGNRVTVELTFHFKDGSFYQETATYLQHQIFQLLAYHQISKGPSFKHAADFTLDVPSGIARGSVTEDNGTAKAFYDHLKLTSNLSNGILTTLLLEIDPKASKTDLSMVVLAPKPRVVKLVVTPAGQDSFTVGGAPNKALLFNVKIDIGGVAGVIAPLVGKQPPDIHIWISSGKAPGFLKSEAPLYEGGPIWKIQLASPDWGEKH